MPPLDAPGLIRSLKPVSILKQRRLWAATLIGSAVAIGCTLIYNNTFQLADVSAYEQIADGQPAMLPFASRQLAPQLVRGLAAVTHLSVRQGFFIEGLCALFVALAAVLWLVIDAGPPRWMLAAVAGSYFWTLQFHGLGLPDLFYTALLALMLVLLRRNRTLAAALMLFPLMLTRESTLLTLLCLLVAGWRRLRWHQMGVAVLAALAGIAVVRRLTANSPGNTEQISATQYLLFKLPWNALKNFLGIFPYSDVHHDCFVPAWQVPVHLGPIHAIGVCEYDWQLPAWTLYSALSVFGLLSAVFWRLRRVRPVAESPGDSVLLRFAAIYGGLSFVLAGSLGAALPRLFAYSWPLFFVLLPRLLAAGRVNFPSSRAALAFLALHLSLTWLMWQLNEPLLWQTVLLYGCGCWLLARTFRAPAELPQGPIFDGIL